MNKGLVKVYTIRDNEHKNDKPHGIVSNKVGMKVSIIFSLFVQFDNIILSLLDVMSSKYVFLLDVILS